MDKGSYGDAVLYHPGETGILEVIQVKSSDYVSNGESPSGTGLLQLGKPHDTKQKTLYAEWNKILEGNKRFISGKEKVVMVVISNKPCKNYEKIKEEILTQDLPWILISEENFEEYAGVFAHPLGYYRKCEQVT